MKKVHFPFLLILFCSAVQAQKSTYTLDELKVKYNPQNYSNQVLLDFQKTMFDLRAKPELSEDVKGEIISWFTLNGRYSLHNTYWVKNNQITEVKTIPSDSIFLNKINQYVPEKSRFTYGSNLWSFAFVQKKLDSEFYLIRATAKSFNSHPDIPNDVILSFLFEYKTRDFIQFQLIRLKEIHAKEWIEVAEN